MTLERRKEIEEYLHGLEFGGDYNMTYCVYIRELLSEIDRLEAELLKRPLSQHEFLRGGTQ